MYITKFSGGTGCKNRLETAVRDYLEKLDRTIVQDDQLQQFEESVIAEVTRLHAKEFPRCKPVQAKFWSPNNYSQEPERPRKKDRALVAVYFATFKLLYAETFYK